MLDGQGIDLVLWDTAGQEQFQALTPLYARSSAVAIFVASITDPRSFTGLDSWIRLLVSANRDPPPMVLAVNKVDLKDKAPMAIDKIDSQFRPRFAGLFFVSALTNEEVDNLFTFAAQAAVAFIQSKDPEPRNDLIQDIDTAPERKCC
jgi:small GTP-binding protein